MPWSSEFPRPSRSLKGKAAIVTGAGSPAESLGNGRAISILLAEDGASVLCVDINSSFAERTAEIIRSEGGNALAFRADVTSATDCEAAVTEAVRAFGRLDILVNNVGIFGAQGTAVEVDIDSWKKSMDVNVTSLVLMTKYAVPAMLKNDPGDGGIRGSIVNMGSVAGLQGGHHSLLYPTSKGTVVQMTRAMAAHHGKDGVRVNTVCPGMMYTPMVGSGGEMSAETREARRKRSLLRTEGNAWDAAASVRFLAGGDARWITGTVLTVDAGASSATLLN